MFQLNKRSHLLTIPADIKLAEIKKQLADEGLYLGYYPLEEIHYSLSYYINRRIPNLYHFKFGSLADLVSSVILEFRNGRTMHLRDAPRSAIGPDYNRFVIGSKEAFGNIKDVTLRVSPLPEKIIHGVALVSSRDQAKELLRLMVAQFFPPLFFRYFDMQEAARLLQALHFPDQSNEVLLFCLAGLHEMVTTEEDIISQSCQARKVPLYWIGKKEGRDLVNEHLHNLDSYRQIKDQYRQFLWPTQDSSEAPLLEKRFVGGIGSSL